MPLQLLCQGAKPAPTAASAEVDMLIQSFPIGSGSPEPYLDASPVFVVGLPRSGSSLMELILSSHSQVVPGGEDTDFAPRVGKLMERLGKAHTEAAKVEAIRGEARKYVEEMRQRLGIFNGPRRSVRHFTDKMLANYRNLGFLRMMLPKAKVIHMVRDPLDCCLSIFQQPLEMSMHAYACDLQACGEQYIQHRRLMQHWEKVLWQQIIVVDYEKLVDNFDFEVKRVLQFVGLEWEEQLRTFFRTPGVVTTASMAQVRKPLNKAGIAKWRRYPRKALDPLIQILQKSGYASNMKDEL